MFRICQETFDHTTMNYESCLQAYRIQIAVTAKKTRRCLLDKTKGESITNDCIWDYF